MCQQEKSSALDGWKETQIKLEQLQNQKKLECNVEKMITGLETRISSKSSFEESFLKNINDYNENIKKVYKECLDTQTSFTQLMNEVQENYKTLSLNITGESKEITTWLRDNDIVSKFESVQKNIINI